MLLHFLDVTFSMQHVTFFLNNTSKGNNKCSQKLLLRNNVVSL